MRLKLNLRVLSIIVIFILFLVTRFSNLRASPVWEDNMSWLYRINYYAWLIETNFKGHPEPGKDLKYIGRISYHPGVTVMTASGISFRIGKNLAPLLLPQYTQCTFNDYACPYIQYELFWAKLPLILIGAVLVTLCLNLIFKIFDLVTGILFGCLILFEPMCYIASRDLHLDFTHSILILTSLLFFLNFKKTSSEKTDHTVTVQPKITTLSLILHRILLSKNLSFYMSAIFFGLALLTRITSLLFLPAYLIIWILNDFLNHHYLAQQSHTQISCEAPRISLRSGQGFLQFPAYCYALLHRPLRWQLHPWVSLCVTRGLDALLVFAFSKKKLGNCKTIREALCIQVQNLTLYLHILWNFLIYCLIAIIIFIAVYPPMWVAPIETTEYIISNAYGSTRPQQKTYNKVTPLQLSSNYFNGFAIYFNEAINNLSPLYLLLLTISILIIVTGLTVKKIRLSAYFYYIYIFYLIYFCLLNISDKRFGRYLLPIILGIGVTLAHFVAKLFTKFYMQIHSNRPKL